jgi:uncharacterized protein
MASRRFRLFLLVILVCVSGSAYAIAPGNPANALPDKSQLQIISKTGKHIFKVEVADTPEKWEKGLMWRSKMPVDSGMLFLFPEARIANMWMKDTEIPLDMVFIKEGWEISKIVANTTPFSLETISSDIKIIAVLELNAGLCQKIGIRQNDKIIFQGSKQDAGYHTGNTSR